MPIGRQIKIISITGGSSSSPADIDSGNPCIVAIVNSGYCRLPSGAEIGDIVEVYGAESSGAVFIVPPSSESFIASDAAPHIIKYGGAFFRKVAATKWAYILSELQSQ
jgi:hypothetical protein